MAEIARRDVFQAIADPTRRKIIDLLTAQSMNMNSIAQKLDMTQPAISQQIKFLVECGIVEIEITGRERYCKIKTENLVPAFMWLEKYHKEWISRVDEFEQYVNQLQSKTKKKNPDGKRK